MCPEAHTRLVTIISANAEWGPVCEVLTPARLDDTPYGQCFLHRMGNVPVMFFHGGWGKIAAAASAEYAIARWQPEVLVNLGTCGGIEGRVTRGETLLVNRTIVYDIHEAMGDASEAIDHYTTDIDVTWLPSDLAARFAHATLLTGDRDLVPQAVADLAERYGAVAADWESGAIAYVAARRGTPLLILRTVSDLVSPVHADATGLPAVFVSRAADSMRSLLEQYALLAPRLALGLGEGT